MFWLFFLIKKTKTSSSEVEGKKIHIFQDLGNPQTQPVYPSGILDSSHQGQRRQD